MSDKPDQDSKTEAATDKKKRDAVDKGNTPNSRELSNFASLSAITCIMLFAATGSVAGLVAILRDSLDRIDSQRLLNGHDGLALVTWYGQSLVMQIAGPLALLSAAGVAASLFQNQPALVLERIKPQLSRISPASGWKRLFSRQAVVELAKGIAAIGAVLAVSTMILKTNMGLIVNSMHVHANALPELLLSVCVSLLAGVVLCSMAIAVADLLWSRHKWLFDLRMTKQEVKDELKQAEGDPLVKVRLRSLQRDRRRRRMMQAVPGATLIITNPTHYAVALKYTPGVTAAPVVVAKGTELVALKIREIAAEHKVPVLENKPLARGLYDAVEVSQMIPSEFYHAVAELIQQVYNTGRPPQHSIGESR
jgi:flagellar biosynthetic protein FlhB